ncbi:DNA protecting protein DprA [Cellulomonas flavigena DSM 20109]|uniref:DNA protecting protein DprA n=1 Tax=Cellulomonas flavigena (strain ATCC 482 / DSM 20109 / BCRC 11376 / JCM 18109 / NBRC 3775 / NCIMB 8073 / NRS 134) TaxID=446466 RepID=D5UD41_CELFN|nr:DNA-processing protein DprA [Cellulomonas flavigena]ADG74378.1 DNA protecting protein DprA [Cellulomonas flavigena DSM 20109]
MTGTPPGVTWCVAPDDERAARAVWSALAEPGDAVAGALVQACGAAPALAWVADAVATPHPDWAVLETLGGGGDDALRRRVGLGVARWAARWPALDPERDRAAAQRCGARLVVPGDPAWPRGLDDLGVLTPFALWVRGAPPVADRTLAVVGARASTTYGERVTVDLAVELARRGWAVVSGGAYGIDAAAHRGALLGGGVTHVVLAGGVDRAYPAGNARLLEEVVRAGGSLFSEVPPGATPSRARFLQRNRLIAASAQATVVVEAAWRSGAASTAHHAARLLRPVGAVPGPVTSAASAGCHRLLRDGVAVCITDAAEAIELAGDVGPDLAPTPDAGVTRPTDGLDPLARLVHDGLARRTARDVTVVAARAGTTVAQARAMLGLLELEGLARRTASGWVVADGHE